MKLELSKNLFDDYAWKARVLPALICIAPAILATGVMGYLDGSILLLSILGGLGVVFLVAQLVRSLGRTIEKKLVEQWRGMPTTHLLRFSTQQNNSVHDARHRKLASITGIALPSRRKEAASPAESDELYIAATRSLIGKVRQRKQNFPRVHEENTNYGFRRNLLALKPVARAILILLVVFASMLLYLGHYIIQASLILGIALVFATVWGVITPHWVKDAADAYADRLFETLDELA